MNLRELGGAPATLKAPATLRGKPSKFLEKQQLTYLSWNAGSLTTAVWEELLSSSRPPAMQESELWQFRRRTGEVTGSSPRMGGMS